MPWEVADPVAANLSRPNGLAKANMSSMEGPTVWTMRSWLRPSPRWLPVAQGAVIIARTIFRIDGGMFQLVPRVLAVKMFRLIRIPNLVAPSWTFQ